MAYDSSGKKSSGKGGGKKMVGTQAGVKKTIGTQAHGSTGPATQQKTMSHAPIHRNLRGK